MNADAACMVLYEGLKSVRLSQHGLHQFALLNFAWNIAWNKQHPLAVLQRTKTIVDKAPLSLTGKSAFEEMIAHYLGKPQ
jgi:hypothetical protein